MNDVELHHNMTPNMLKGVNEITSILMHRNEDYEDVAVERIASDMLRMNSEDTMTMFKEIAARTKDNTTGYKLSLLTLSNGEEELILNDVSGKYSRDRYVMGVTKGFPNKDWQWSLPILMTGNDPELQKYLEQYVSRLTPWEIEFWRRQATSTPEWPEVIEQSKAP